MYIYIPHVYMHIYIHIHTCLYKCIAFSPVKELPMTLPGDLLAHPVNEHIEIYIYIYIRSRKYSTTWDLPTCQAFQLLLVTRRWWSSLLEASEWWAILGGFLLLTIESNYLFELKSCSGAPDSTKTLQASLKFSNHWDAPICSPCQDASDKWVFS